MESRAPDLAHAAATDGQQHEGDALPPAGNGQDPNAAQFAGTMPVGTQSDKPETSKKARHERAIVVFAVGLILVIGAGMSWYLSVHQDMSGVRRAWLIVAGATPCALLALMAAMAVRSTSEWFAWLSDILALIVVALGIGVLPALFLSPATQVHLLKLGLLVILSLAPGLLYFQFLRARAPALWDDFVVTLRALDIRDYGEVPDRTRIVTVDSKDPAYVYRQKFEATYGRVPAGQARGKALFPVLCVTVLVSIGWAATLQPEGLTHWQIGGGKFHLPNTLDYVALRFGFVGITFFMSQMLVRRYFQNDLKADAYVTCLLRLFTGMFLIAVVTAALPELRGPRTIALAFAIGLFPQIGIDIIRTKLLRPFAARMKGLDAQYGLSLLDGMNVWYEARLLEEGIEDLQNLKTANWIDLLLQTRIPPGRIVDWVDQAILIIHVIPPPDRQAHACMQAVADSFCERVPGVLMLPLRHVA